MIKPENLLPQVSGMISRKEWHDLRNLLVDQPVPDIGELITDLEKDDRVVAFRLLPRPLATEVFGYLEPFHKDVLIQDLSREETRYLLDHLRPDDRTDYFEELPGLAIQRLLNLLSPEELREARQLLGFPRESVGRLMTPDYVAVREHWTIDEALRHIRKVGKESETINWVFVVDDSWHLLDEIELRQFIFAEPTEVVKHLMDESVARISAYEDREKAVEMMQHYDVNVLPVVDSDGILLGIVTVDDVLDVAVEEATEDFHKTAAVEPLRTSYSDTGIWSLYRKRIIWLATLLVVGLGSGTVIHHFEKALLSTISLAFFIPLLMSTAGNTGAQSSTLVVRAIATGDLAVSEWLRTVTRELGIGLLLGVTLAFAGWWLGFFKGGAEIALIVSTAMLSVVLVTNIIGVVIPLLLTKLDIDPAVASNPLIMSIADVGCLFIYFTIAAMVLG
jgi:magnesium transporter